MNTGGLLVEIRNKVNELKTVIPFIWRTSPAPLKDPLNAFPKENWPGFKHLGTPVKKNGKNWLYTKVVFPAKKAGFP